MPKFFSRKFSWKQAALLVGIAVSSGLIGWFTSSYYLFTHPRVYEITRYGVPFSREALKLNLALELISENYVEERKVKDKSDLTVTALHSLMKALGDKHGGYWTPRFTQYMQEHSVPNNFAGIGVEIQWFVEGGKKGVQIMDFFDGSLAEHAGIQRGDVITKIKDPETGEMQEYGHIREYAKRLKGPVGSTVSFEVLRGSSNMGVVHLQRVETKYQTVYAKNYECNLLLRVKNFASLTADEILKDAERELGDECGKQYKGIVLDLRNNPGGLLTSAVDVSDQWTMIGSLIASFEPRVGEKQQFRAKVIPPFRAVPTVILVNERSASASEITAKALSIFGEHVWILGRTTYGKGSVQHSFPLGDGSSISITVARYKVANNIGIDKNGVTPNIKMDQPEVDGFHEPSRQFNYYLIRATQNPVYDLELAEALKILNAYNNGEVINPVRWKVANKDKKIKCWPNTPCSPYVSIRPGGPR